MARYGAYVTIMIDVPVEVVVDDSRSMIEVESRLCEAAERRLTLADDIHVGRSTATQLHRYVEENAGG